MELLGKLDHKAVDQEADQGVETLMDQVLVNNQVNQEIQEHTVTDNLEDQDNFHITAQEAVELLMLDNQDHRETLHKVETVVTEEQHQLQDHQPLWLVEAVEEVGVTQDPMAALVAVHKVLDHLLKLQVTLALTKAVVAEAVESPLDKAHQVLQGKFLLDGDINNGRKKFRNC